MSSFFTQTPTPEYRRGIVTTAHGSFQTPAFMSVGTQATVKALTPDDLRMIGAEIILGNTYHLYLRPGVEAIKRFGGLHKFMSWSGPILTDSGGFQVLSLAKLRKLSDEGVEFQSHLDGAKLFFSPAEVMRAQEALGSDIMMCLDQCISYESEPEAVHNAMLLTHRWAAKCKESHINSHQHLFAIVQGGSNLAWRQESAKTLTDMDFPGYAIGGTGVGEPKSVLWEMVEAAIEHLPKDKPRYLMGIGAPEDLLEGVARGVDMFDCALPTRVARNGALFSPDGRVNMRAPQFQSMDAPLDATCDCYTCKHFSAAYISHLYRSEELLAYRLGTIHNLRFILRLMEGTRQAIVEGRFTQYKAAFLNRYKVTDEETRLEQKRKWMERIGRDYIQK